MPSPTTGAHRAADGRLALEGKTMLITGGASGIGAEIARVFAEAGAQVAIVDRDLGAAESLARTLETDGAAALALACDVAIESQLLAAIDRAAALMGRLDILINNAGLQYVSPIEDFPTEQFERLHRVMLIAPFVAIKRVFPLMKAQGAGRILNMASINGLVGFAGKAAYNAAKHGIIGLTKVAALEGAASGITVNALCPGYVDTPLVRGQLADLAATRQVPVDRVLEEVIFPLVPQRRLIAVREVADYALFLASDRAPGVPGQAIVLDGGYTAQ